MIDKIVRRSYRQEFSVCTEIQLDRTIQEVPDKTFAIQDIYFAGVHYIRNNQSRQAVPGVSCFDQFLILSNNQFRHILPVPIPPFFAHDLLRVFDTFDFLEKAGVRDAPVE
jgi:hypothetical protein